MLVAALQSCHIFSEGFLTFGHIAVDQEGCPIQANYGLLSCLLQSEDRVAPRLPCRCSSWWRYMPSLRGLPSHGDWRSAAGKESPDPHQELRCRWRYLKVRSLHVTLADVRLTLEPVNPNVEHLSNICPHAEVFEHLHHVIYSLGRIEPLQSYASEHPQGICCYAWHVRVVAHVPQEPSCCFGLSGV